ncbi:hypothetical protein BGZ49_006120 [Haplosporangium sp. Z 27]|nr:hypothetical protein BGZ49_006120 [Haplosporangium sp. Z 27]
MLTNHKQFLQALRPVYKGDISGTVIPSSSKTVSVKPRIDSQTGEFIILWQDITLAIKNALHVWHGDTIIPFHTDDNFEFLQPLRISAYPGVVLDVVTDTPIIEPSVEPLEAQASPTLTLLSIGASSIRTSQSNSELRSSSPASTPVMKKSPLRQARRVPQGLSPMMQHILPSRTPSLNQGQNYVDSYSAGAGVRGSDLTLFSTQKHNSGIAKDENEKFVEYERQDMNANYDRGLAYYKGRNSAIDYLKAMEWFLKAANQGHHDAQYRLGFMYQNGQGVERNYSQAMEWYQAAADQGYAKSQSSLGYMYANGLGVPQDFRKAVDWYYKAAVQGYATAQCGLGYMYQKGYGLTRDNFKAVEWLQKAADQGYHAAQFILGSMYDNGEGVTQNYSKAAEWYQRASNQGHAGAECNLGILYASGNGVALDYSKAIELYRKAAVQGNARAQCNLGFMYYHGYGVNQDYTKSADWYRLAAGQGYSAAQCNLGVMYYEGKGVPKDISKAVEWWKKAASQRYADAQYNLFCLQKNGIPSKKWKFPFRISK